MAAEAEAEADGGWRRSLFGARLVRPSAVAPAAEGPLDLCPVDAIAPDPARPTPTPTDEPAVLAVYFRPLADPEPEDSLALVEALRGLYTGRAPDRLQVVQVFLPPWVGFRRSGSERDFGLVFRQKLAGVPWFTMPIDDEVKWVRLKHLCRGRAGMVRLVCARSGRLLLKDAGPLVRDDPHGHGFPWLPRPFAAIMADAANGLVAGGLRRGPKIVPYSSLDGFIKGLYFSAHWCPPCKAFTPQLVDCYRKIRARGHKFEVIFVSSDRSEESYESYLSTMPWTALPFKSGVCRELASLLDVHGIPSLVLIDVDGTVITEDGRAEANDDLDGEFFPWRHRPVNILTDRLTEMLYDSPAIVLFLDGEEDEDLDFGEEVLLPVADWAASANLNLDYRILFFVAVENGASESLRAFTKLDDAAPLVTAIDFPLNRFSVMEYGAEITEHSVKTFVLNFINDKLAFTPISDSENGQLTMSK